MSALPISNAPNLENTKSIKVLFLEPSIPCAMTMGTRGEDEPFFSSPGKSTLWSESDLERQNRALEVDQELGLAEEIISVHLIVSLPHNIKYSLRLFFTKYMYKGRRYFV